jgi:hypothetical protein
MCMGMLSRQQGLAGQTLLPPASLRSLSDDALLAGLENLVRQERESTADVVEHLWEVERRELVLGRAYPSLYEYCTKKLGYTESGAAFRMRAARAAAEFPGIIERLRSGRLHLEAVVRISPHLTDSNHADLLDRVDGASKREVVALVASMQPWPPPTRDVVTPIAAAERTTGRSSSAPEDPRIEVVPLLNHRFHFTGDAELLQLVSRLRGFLRHKYPEGRLESIFKEAAKALLERLENDRAPRARSAPANTGSVPLLKRAGSRFVPRSVKREVWTRDGGRCAFRAEDGALCGSREALEYDHIIAWADGGRSDAAENIRLLCRAHNQFLGRRRFGARRRLC